ncbi:MAG: integrase, partial [Gaiellaceae bacterium]
MLCHPGRDRTEQSIRCVLTWPGLSSEVEKHVQSCTQCQLFKKQRKKYGHLPPKVAESLPWAWTCVDLVGPYHVSTPSGDKVLKAMTMIDPATSWMEIHEIPDKQSITTSEIFDREWLCRYPRPKQVIYDNGSEFKGTEFQELLFSYGIKGQPTTVRNPQANAILERVHQVLANMLRTFELEKQEFDQNNPWSGFLAATAWALRSTYHTTLAATPGQLVFGRDMIFNFQHVANWERIRLRKQRLILTSNQRENSRRIIHQYNIGDHVLIDRLTTRKLNRPRDGPFLITHVYTNGTVQVQRGPVSERFN